MFDVRGFGAKGDKKHNDSRTIQEAMDACFKSGGGTVVFPAGDYLSGSVFPKKQDNPPPRSRSDPLVQ